MSRIPIGQPSKTTHEEKPPPDYGAQIDGVLRGDKPSPMNPHETQRVKHADALVAKELPEGCCRSQAVKDLMRMAYKNKNLDDVWSAFKEYQLPSYKNMDPTCYKYLGS
ncbi:hypothetical protein FE257_009703 [Aspergillus nanangensis]|uniref:Uncharacterized protein n=1 Tax=Aspergillus nanangensis TaxID=2582783 RepID=A0AAD4CJQ0_ASPNN|nr:hypothetical protein FE257_009703 [Aspergillus nanangensis]